MLPDNGEESGAPLNPTPVQYTSNRFRIQSVHSDKDSLDGSLLDLNLGSHYNSHTDSIAFQDNASVGNTSMFSQLTADIASGSRSIIPWLTDPGSALGSSILLASKSYLNIYADVSSHKSIEAIEEETGVEDIFDNPEYIDTLEGRLPLAEAARMIAKDSSKHESLFSPHHIRTTRNDCYKRLVCIGVSLLLLFSSSYGVGNATSSLGHDQQMSLVCYGLVFSLVWFGGVCANPIITKIKPKWALALATTGFITYPISMFHMAYYTTLPASIYHGFCIGLLWGVEGVYLINTAATYSLVSAKPLADIIRQFNGIIFMFFLSANILGNLISSLLLGDLYTLPGEMEDLALTVVQNQSLSSSSAFGKNGGAVSSIAANTVHNFNSTDSIVCGLQFYSQGQTNRKIKIYISKQYLLFGVYTLLPVLAALNIIIFLRKLKVAKRPGSGNIFKQLKCVVQTIADRKSLLLTPLMTYIGIHNTTILADYTACFISCSYGVDMVGYVIMAAFALSVVGVSLGTKLVEYIGRIPVVSISLIIGLGSPIFMLLWKPIIAGTISPLAFITPCLWGMSHGNIVTQTNSFVGLVYRKNIVHGVTMITTFVGIGSMLGTFPVAFGAVSLATKLYILISINVVSCLCYIVLEYLLKKEILS